MLRLWVLAALVAAGCSAPTHPVARYYAFHTKWPVDVDRAWDAAVSAVAARDGTRAVDRTHGIIMTPAAPIDARDPSLTVEYVVELRNTYASFRRASTDVPVGLRVIVAPVVTKAGQVLPPEQVPVAAQDHRDELLGVVKEAIWRSGAVH